MRPPALICPQCSSAECGPAVCRFSGESHAEYRKREASLAAIQHSFETKGYVCECPSWWGCQTRGCYEQAKQNYGNTISRAPQPGNADYLSSSDRTEDRINASVYFGGEPHKR